MSAADKHCSEERGVEKGTGSRGGAFYLERCWLLVYWCNEDHQLVIDAQVAKDVTLWHRDVKPQDLQDIVDRHRLVLIQLHTEVEVSNIVQPTLK